MRRNGDVNLCSSAFIRGLKSRNLFDLVETSAPKKVHELEAGLMRSQADSEKLMEAVVGRMLAE